jgi:putative chitinase
LILSKEQLIQATNCAPDVAAKWIDLLNKAMERFEINTPARAAAFIAQIAVESNLLSHVEENLNYSASGLLATFPSHFTEAEALIYQHRPVKIACRAYANRYGNGDEASGDGWKNRGRGFIQITFHDNYVACGTALGLDLVENPDILLIPDNAAASAGWYWHSRNCNQLADVGAMRAITKAVNGGYNGLQQRIDLWVSAKKVIV